MEAPEKLYCTTLEDGRLYYTSGIPFEREYVEYTRTDAFIEKACEWLSAHFYDEDYQSRDNEGTWIDAGSLIEDFKQYIKG